MISVKINDIVFDDVYIEGRQSDSSWDYRETKSITFKNVLLDEIINILNNDVVWSILIHSVQSIPLTDENNNTKKDENGNYLFKEVEYVEEYDNSEYSLLGDITIHPDKTITVKMGKPTDLENVYMLMLGGE